MTRKKRKTEEPKISPAQKQYLKAKKATNYLFIPLFVILLIANGRNIESHPAMMILLTVNSVVLCVTSGIAAYLHSKLPPHQREKQRGITYTIFGISPAVTFVVLLLFMIVCIRGVILTVIA